MSFLQRLLQRGSKREADEVGSGLESSSDPSGRRRWSARRQPAARRRRRGSGGRRCPACREGHHARAPYRGRQLRRHHRQAPMANSPAVARVLPRFHLRRIERDRARAAMGTGTRKMEAESLADRHTGRRHAGRRVGRAALSELSASCRHIEPRRISDGRAGETPPRAASGCRRP